MLTGLYLNMTHYRETTAQKEGTQYLLALDTHFASDCPLA